ncbi:hypothetical protein HY992_05505 [Candidatus Micrarchaeota archaeon]|nr:hypothetical protein [Candidatus Micrarchaeota archaeon]
MQLKGADAWLVQLAKEFTNAKMMISFELRDGTRENKAFGATLKQEFVEVKIQVLTNEGELKVLRTREYARTGFFEHEATTYSKLELQRAQLETAMRDWRNKRLRERREERRGGINAQNNRKAGSRQKATIGVKRTKITCLKAKQTIK